MFDGMQSESNEFQPGEVKLLKQSSPVAALALLCVVLLCGVEKLHGVEKESTGKIPQEAATITKGNGAQNQVGYERDIAPLLEKHCVDCHGPDLQESRFRVDRRAWLLRGGNSGEPAVVPGEPGKSYLLKLIRGDEAKLKMPPEEPALSSEEVALLSDWIAAGAVVPGSENEEKISLQTDHWSFQPLADVSVPAGIAGWGVNPVDAFVGEKLQEKNLQPSASADRKDLIRRVYLVMTGLPPSPEAVGQFVNDTRAEAYAELVEQVLQSPHYGERWAQHWLDLVRFGETTGFETNRERPTAWYYRDYVIRSLNADKPYDQFVKEQIAGDACGVDVGTGYLVAGPHDIVKSPDINLTLMQRQDELADLINTTGTAFLGLTLGCARCHNHKFDPVTQTDYYSIQALFAGVEHGERSLGYPRGSVEELRLATLQKEKNTIDEQLARLGLQEPVNSRKNQENFTAVLATSLRFTVLATNDGNEPCLDELEIFGAVSPAGKPEKVPVEVVREGITASGTLPGYAIHQLKHVCDGQVGNRHSWISNEAGKGWVQIDLPRPMFVSRLVWGRDRLGEYRDRTPSEYRVEVLTPAEVSRKSRSRKNQTKNTRWQVVASSLTRFPKGGGRPGKKTAFVKKMKTTGQTELMKLVKKRDQLDKEYQELVKREPKAYLGTFRQPGPTYRLYRGEPLAKREEVTPDTLAVLGTLGLEKNSPEQQRRVRLAEWIASPENPLTARVIVNRLWQFHFGTGIVDTPSDFGGNGTAPTHPELLDWLATELVGHDWSLKHVHRLILSSQTYQQSSHPNQLSVKIDADTRYLWRFPPRRLEAEVIRDQMLAVSGVLDLKRGGPGFSAFAVNFENVRHYYPKTEYGPTDWRRMVYMTKVRQEKDSVFGVFDCPDASQVTSRRSRSTTPLQALNLFNSTFVLQQAELFAKRLQKEVPGKEDGQIVRAFGLCYNRKPTSKELEVSIRFVAEQGLTAFCRALFNSNEFLFVP